VASRPTARPISTRSSRAGDAGEASCGAYQRFQSFSSHWSPAIYLDFESFGCRSRSPTINPSLPEQAVSAKRGATARARRPAGCRQSVRTTYTQSVQAAVRRVLDDEVTAYVLDMPATPEQ
jgi:hypothetical protein